MSNTIAFLQKRSGTFKDVAHICCFLGTLCATDATRTLRRRYVVATRSARAFHVLARKCDFRDANNPDSHRTPRIYLHGFICSTATANHSWALWLKTLHLDAEPEHPSVQVRECCALGGSLAAVVGQRTGEEELSEEEQKAASPSNPIYCERSRSRSAAEARACE